jgi:hypothetical protein
MRLFYSLFSTAFCAVSLAACSPKLAPLTRDSASAALPTGTPYALIHLYHLGKMTGFMIGYDVHVGDSVSYRARNGSQGEVRRLVPGQGMGQNRSPGGNYARRAARARILRAVYHWRGRRRRSSALAAGFGESGPQRERRYRDGYPLGP